MVASRMHKTAKAKHAFRNPAADEGAQSFYITHFQTANTVFSATVAPVSKWRLLTFGIKIELKWKADARFER